MAVERTFVMIKPDAVMRGTVGDIIKRFERASLKLVGMKMTWPSPEKADGFYPSDEDWLRGLAQKTKNRSKQLGIDVEKEFGTLDELKIGRAIKSWIVKFISSGPVVLMVWEGNNVVEKVRKLIGYTDPIDAKPGSVRADFSQESIDWANSSKRVVMNIVHASGNLEEARQEISYWFSPEELFEYENTFDLMMKKLTG